MFADGCLSVAERHNDNVLFWLDPDNEWILQEAERILSAVGNALVNPPGTDALAATGNQPPAAVMAPNRSPRFRPFGYRKSGRATQRAPPLSP